MGKITLLLAVASMLLTFGCAGAPVAQSDIDPGPYPDNYQQLIAQYLLQTLCDPGSVQEISFDGPPNRITLTMGFPKFGLMKGMEVYECKYVWFNAKNRMGGYTGRNAHVYLIRHGQVVGGW